MTEPTALVNDGLDEDDSFFPRDTRILLDSFSVSILAYWQGEAMVVCLLAQDNEEKTWKEGEMDWKRRQLVIIVTSQLWPRVLFKVGNSAS